MKKQFWAHVVFLLIVAGDLWAVSAGTKWVELNLKPAIMPWIGVYYLWQSKGSYADRFFLPAMFFCWVGDILLMFADTQPDTFLFGLGSFLIAQVLYIFTFRSMAQLGGKPANWVWMGALLLLVYGAGLYYFLLPHLDAVLKIAVALYALAITGMAIAALQCQPAVRGKVLVLLVSGALLFVASDSMIAFQSFVAPFPMDRLWIMATYIGAQYLLMRGILAGAFTLRSEAA